MIESKGVIMNSKLQMGPKVKKVLEMNKKNVRIKTILFSELCKSASVIEVHGKSYINCIKQSGITIL